MTHDANATTRLIRQLQDRLLSLGGELEDRPAADIEKQAKAINSLLVSLEKAQKFIDGQTGPAPGAGLTKPSRLDLLRKIKRMVDNGVLKELDDQDDR